MSHFALDTQDPSSPSASPQLHEVIEEIVRWRFDVESWRTSVDTFYSIVRQSTNEQLRSRSLFDTYMNLYEDNTRLDAGGDELNGKWSGVVGRDGVDEDDVLGPEDLEALRSMRDDDLCRSVPIWDEINRRYDSIIEELIVIIIRDNPGVRSLVEDSAIHELCEWEDAVSELCKE